MQKLYVLLDTDGYISVSYSGPDHPDAMEIDVPDDFDLSRQHHYKIVEGRLVHDPLPEPEPPIDPTTRISALEEELLVSYLAQAELYEKTLAQESENLITMLAVAEIYEKMLGGN